MQGFDEFMNLVIDDAIEVKVKSKDNPEESRRSLGMLYVLSCPGSANRACRSNLAQG